MGAPIAPKWIKSASSVANAKTLENTADGGYQEVDALSADVKAALSGAASPSAENPFATLADVGSGSGGGGDGVGGVLYLYNRMGGF